MSMMRLLINTLLAASILSAPLVQLNSLPLVLVVRDGQGNPLAGLTLRLLEAGPPPEPFDNCVTDQNGQCRLMIPPGSYVVRFEGGGWGHEFVPADQQNSGGFSIYFEPSDREQVVTFVVGQRDGQLVPLWDMSRDPDARPQPLAPDSGSLEDIDLNPPAAAATEDAQIIQSTLDVGGSISTPLPTVTQAAPVDTGIPADAIWLGVIGFLVIAVLLVVIVLASARLRRKGAR